MKEEMYAVILAKFEKIGKKADDTNVGNLHED